MSRLCLALCHMLPTARLLASSGIQNRIEQFYSSQADFCKSSKQSPELQAIVLCVIKRILGFLNPIKCNHSKHLKNIKAAKIEHWAKCIAAQKVPYKRTVLLSVTNFGGFVLIVDLKCQVLMPAGFGESFVRMSECYLFSWVMSEASRPYVTEWIFFCCRLFSLFIVALLFFPAE